MATRCNVIIKDGLADSKVILYRHWDGYPAETGADLAEHLKRALADRFNGGFRAFLTSLISAKRGGEDRDADRPQYEVTDCIHGDIEHLYEFLFITSSAKSSAPRVRISHQMRRPGDEFSAPIYLTLEEFVGMVNADRVAMNQRIAHLKSSSAHYADVEQYPMVSL